MHSEHEVLIQFLADVDEQIRYQPMHAAVNEELKAHIEDKAETYMEYGMEEEEAFRRAVREMGDASAIGIQMNEAHHLRTAKPLLVLLFVLMGIGMLGNFAARGFDWMTCEEQLYILWGALVLVLVMRYGYPLLLKHMGKLMILFLVLTAGNLCIHLAWRRDWLLNFGCFQYLFSPSVQFGILQLAIPAAAVQMYRRRCRGLRGLFEVYGFLAVPVAASFFFFGAGYTHQGILVLLLCCLGVSCYMVGKGYLKVEKKRGFAGAFLGVLVLAVIWAVPERERLARSLELCFHPEAQAASAWEDGYNGVLMRELLGKSEWFGSVSLSEEEKLRFYTSEWYFTDGPGEWQPGGIRELEDYVRYKMQFQGDPALKLRDLLPDGHGRNYRIARWILSYGRIPALFLTLLPLWACALMFAAAFQIRNRLGRLTALSGSLALSLQSLFYLAGNLGYQFGAFGNLPFVSEGLVSITGSAVMAGLVLSAYRFDTVLKKKD